MVYRIISTIMICFLFHFVGGQPTSGTSGLLNIPSAEMNSDGTFFMGSNYLPNELTPEEFDYNTGNYYFNITFLPFIEINYRLTLLKMNTGNYNQDRSFGMRIRLLQEKKILPSFVIGGNDLYSSSGKQSGYFNSIYGVATKQISLKETKIGITAGYAQEGFGKIRKENLNGFFGGLSVCPGFFPSLKIMGEYDTNGFNTGFSAMVLQHLFIFGFLRDFSVPAGGLAYYIYL